MTRDQAIEVAREIIRSPWKHDTPQMREVCKWFVSEAELHDGDKAEIDRLRADLVKLRAFTEPLLKELGEMGVIT